MVGHQLNKSVEQIADVVRAGAGFRVTLKAECRRIGTGKPLQRTVEQRNMGAAQIGRQRRRIDRKAMILTGDRHPSAIQILDRVIGTVVAEFHFYGFGTRSQRKQLMTEADSKDRKLRRDQLSDCADRVIAGLRVAGAVGKENSIWLECQNFGCSSRGG